MYFVIYIIFQYILRYCYQTPQQKSFWNNRTVSMKAEEFRDSLYDYEIYRLVGEVENCMMQNNS